MASFIAFEVRLYAHVVSPGKRFFFDDDLLRSIALPSHSRPQPPGNGPTHTAAPDPDVFVCWIVRLIPRSEFRIADAAPLKPEQPSRVPVSSAMEAGVVSRLIDGDDGKTEHDAKQTDEPDAEPNAAMPPEFSEHCGFVHGGHESERVTNSGGLLPLAGRKARTSRHRSSSMMTSGIPSRSVSSTRSLNS